MLVRRVQDIEDVIACMFHLNGHIGNGCLRLEYSVQRACKGSRQYAIEYALNVRILPTQPPEAFARSSGEYAHPPRENFARYNVSWAICEFMGLFHHDINCCLP